MADDAPQYEGLAEHAVVWLAPREVCNNDMRALVITDLHLTLHHPVAKTLPRLLRTLAQIILDKRLNVLFILGDLFDHSKPRDQEKNLKLLLKALDTLTVLVIIIPGVIEQALMREQIPEFRDTNINIIYNKISEQDGQIIHLRHPNPRRGTYPSIFLTYNGGCTRPIRPSESRVFLMCMKQKYVAVRIMKADDLLMVGAVHKHMIVESEKTVGLDQFSFDNKTLFYALITAEGAFHIDYANLPVPEIK
jgi:hypothetical protein